MHEKWSSVAVVHEFKRENRNAFNNCNTVYVISLVFVGCSDVCCGLRAGQRCIAVCWSTCSVFTQVCLQGVMTQLRAQFIHSDRLSTVSVHHSAVQALRELLQQQKPARGWTLLVGIQWQILTHHLRWKIHVGWCHETVRNCECDNHSFSCICLLLVLCNCGAEIINHFVDWQKHLVTRRAHIRAHTSAKGDKVQICLSLRIYWPQEKETLCFLNLSLYLLNICQTHLHAAGSASSNLHIRDCCMFQSKIFLYSSFINVRPVQACIVAWSRSGYLSGSQSNCTHW